MPILARYDLARSVADRMYWRLIYMNVDPHLVTREKPVEYWMIESVMNTRPGLDRENARQLVLAFLHTDLN